MKISTKAFRWSLFLSALLLFIYAVNYSVTVFSIGDSTMANFSLTSDLRRGWMQNIPPFFNNEVKIVNYAKSGRSSKSFIDEGHWDWVVSKLNPGDYVIIQFGHNDEKEAEALHTDPWTTYTENLRKFVGETRAKGAHPVLCTSIVRRYFNADGTVQKSHGEYPDAVRKLAVDSSVTLVDLNEKTRELLESFGPDSSKLLYNYVEPGESDLYPAGNEDDTHLNDRGATAVAELFLEGLQEQDHPLAGYLLLTALDDAFKQIVPADIQLFQNYPNPFNPVTSIRYSTAQKGHVKIDIFTITGKKIKTLLNDVKPAGNYTFDFDAGRLSSGIYIYRLSVAGITLSKKMILTK